MNNPLVSIIIPTYNRAHLIGETLDSVLAQTYDNWECIIVDDGSMDNTAEVVGNYVKKDARFQYHHRPSERLKGGNASRNFGFELSKGEFIQWFDDDDIMLVDFIKSKINLFENQTDFIITSGYAVDEKLNIIKKIDIDIQTYLFKDYTLWRLKIFPPSVFFRKTFLEQHQLFSVIHLRGQETEIFSRFFFKLSNERFILQNTHLFYYRQHQNTKSQRNKTYISTYIYSLTLNSISNFRRGFELLDNEIIAFHYKLLLSYFFEGINNNDKKNAHFIIKQVSFTLFKFNFYKGIKFFVISSLILNLGVGRTKLKRILTNIYKS